MPIEGSSTIPMAIGSPASRTRNCSSFSAPSSGERAGCRRTAGSHDDRRRVPGGGGPGDLPLGSGKPSRWQGIGLREK